MRRNKITLCLFDRQLKTLYLCQLLGAIFPGCLHATESVQQMDTVEVSGTSDDNAGATYKPPHSRFALPQSVEAVQTLTHKEIAAIRPRDVSDLIENSLGMTIRRQGARVHNFSYDRGDNVSIIIDGVYLTTTTAQRVLGDLPVDAIESIQFIRDSSVITISPLMGFGSANAGAPNQGFIIINTRKHKPDAQHTTEIRSSYASYDTWKTDGFTSQSFLDDKLTIGGGYQHSASNGKSDWHNDYAGDTYLLNAAYRDEAFSADSSLYINNGWRDIQRATGIYEGTTSYPKGNAATPDGVLDKNIWRYDPMNTTVVSTNLARHWNSSQTTALTAGYSNAQGTLYKYLTTVDPATVPGQQAEDWAKEWVLSHTIVSGANTFKTGLQSVEWYQLSEGSSLASQEQIYGFSVSDEYQITPDVLVDSAARMDKKKVIHSSTKYLENGSTVKMTEGQWTDNAYLYSLGSTWQVDPIYRLSSRYAFNYTPTPDSLTVRDNQTLAAEQRHRVELGFNGNFNRAFQSSLTPFYYYIKNAKVSDGTITAKDDSGTDTTITIYTLSDSVIRKGLEWSATGRFADGALGYEVGWTHFYASSDNSITDFPDNKYNARLNWIYHNFDSNINVLKVDPYLSNGYTVGDYTTLNMSIAYHLPYDITLTLYGQNLTDEHYGTMNKGDPSIPNSTAWGVFRDVGATYGLEAGMKF